MLRCCFSERAYFPSIPYAIGFKSHSALLSLLILSLQKSELQEPEQHCYKKCNDIIYLSEVCKIWNYGLKMHFLNLVMLTFTTGSFVL